MNSIYLLTRWIFLLLIFSVCSFSLDSSSYAQKKGGNEDRTTSLSSTSNVTISSSKSNYKSSAPLAANAFIELAKKVNPAVVNISTTVLPKFKMPYGRGARDPFYDMLEQFYGFNLAPQARPQTALGTGFVIRKDGLIITNNHVIAGADKIQVQFEEKGKSFEAKLIGADERTDIALLKIDGNQFPIIPLGDSSIVEVGEWVAAFGNPFGNGHTMTKGIISAKGRDLSEINKFPLLQTDAPINPGNSGGPLVNLMGEVIGVNSAIDARAQGIGFAIPIDGVKKLLPQLEKNGHVKKGYLGVGLADINPQTVSALGLSEQTEGVIIAEVEPQSPADKAGLLPYDIVTHIGDKKITSSFEFRDSIADAEINKPIMIKVLREGRSRQLTATINELPQKSVGRNLQNKLKNTFSINDPLNLGFSIADINSDLKKEFGLSDDIDKPLIIGVSPGSPSAQAGLLIGDVILDINKKEIKKASDVKMHLKKGANTFRIYRGGSILFLVIGN